MKVKIAKEYTWQMSHRLPFHNGLCSNIHGHSYKARITLLGTPNDNGMLIDFYEMDSLIKPIINELEHSFIVDSKDGNVLKFLEENNFRHIVVDSTTTSENLAIWLSKRLSDRFKIFPNIDCFILRFYETSDSFAEVEISLNNEKD
ncbi:MAG: 6-pyruvoyl trahydropterin synthase family protein [Candidatus Kapaibacteriales bacterium]